MWNPFKKITLEPINKTNNNHCAIQLSEDTEKAQLRSLKARIEITMLYEQLAEKALIGIKGDGHAANS